MQGSTLQWTTSGDESTVDHYTIYSSPDGQRLTKLSDVRTGVHSLDLCNVAMPSGKSQVYVQAVGKPSIANRMPGPVSYTAACGN